MAATLQCATLAPGRETLPDGQEHTLGPAINSVRYL